MPPLLQSLIARPIVFWISSPLSWKTEMGGAEAPITQEEIASNLLCDLDIHKSMGLDGDPPKCTGAGRITCHAAFSHYQ